MQTAESYQDNWYEAAMESRERKLADQFGPMSPPNQVFKPQDENWEMTIPGFAFLRFPPTQKRKFWLYITHGLSQPSEFSDFQQGFDGGLSGLGVEFALASPQEEAWTFNLLELLAQYTLKASKPILPLERIPASDLMNESQGGHLLALSAPGYPTELHTLSGIVHVVHLVGVTADETKKAKEYPGAIGSQILEHVLHHFGIVCDTDRSRESITKRPDFDKIWKSCASQIAAT
jgi:hypothetical protein